MGGGGTQTQVRHATEQCCCCSSVCPRHGCFCVPVTAPCRPSLIRGLVRLAGFPTLFVVASLESIGHALGILSPLVLQKLVQYLYTADSSTSSQEGILWALAFLGMGAGGALLSAHQVQLSMRLGFKVQTACVCGSCVRFVCCLRCAPRFFVTSAVGGCTVTFHVVAASRRRVRASV